jgi:putative ABC transport system permease protein
VALFRQLMRGLKVLTRREAADQDVADEVQHYLEEATAVHLARGLPPEAARRAAQLEIGNATFAREQVRDYGWENVVGTTAADVRYAFRRLRQSPGFTAVTVLTLALGVGATTAIFGALYPILIEPLPYPQARRIVMIVETYADGSRSGGTYGMYHGLAERSRPFEALAVFKLWGPALTGDGPPEILGGQRVSARYFRVLGVAPVRGRDFQAADDRANGPNVAIISHALWQRRFAGDHAIVGRAITLDGTPFTVIGVMPAAFRNVLAPSAEVWAPLQYDMAQGRAWGHHLQTVGRLQAGMDLDQAGREVDGLAQRVLREQHPETYGRGMRLVALPLRDEVTRGVRPLLLAVLGAVLLVLAIACVNVTNLLVARGVQRRGEFALRAALGAGQGRMVRQLLTESLLLAVVGGLAGVLVAALGVRALVALAPAALPRVEAIGIHGAVLAFALGVTTIAGVAFGAIPAWQAAHSDPHGELQLASRRSGGAHRRARSALVVAEVALALVLLVASGLLLKSLRRLMARDVGFDASHVLTLRVQASNRFAFGGTTATLLDQALAAVRGVPGVVAAACTSQLPLSGDDDEYGVGVEGQDLTRRDGSFRYGVSPGWVATMRIRLLKGRAFDDRDRAGAPPVALVSAAFAKTMFGAADPIGHRLIIGTYGGYTVVGVVSDVTQVSLALGGSDAVYVPEEQWQSPDGVMSLVVRARGDPAALLPAVRQALWSVDPTLPISRVATMQDLVATSEANRRFALILFEVFGLAALALAAAGIYGVLSGSVAERTRELGVRAVLGASSRDILALVVRQGMTLTGLGVLAGLAGAATASRAIVTLLYGTSRLDPATYAAVIALLGVVAVLASAVPAWRAARVDPAITLRSE